jgi:hypothetical protein
LMEDAHRLKVRVLKKDPDQLRYLEQLHAHLGLTGHQ